MGLHRAQRATRLDGDLVEAHLAEEPQGHDFAVWLIEAAHGDPEAFRTLGEKAGGRRIGSAFDVDPGRWVTRIDPRDVPTSLGATDRDPDGDPGQPSAERACLTPPREAPERDHERLLRGILGLVEVAEDPVTGADHGSRFLVDEKAERLPISREDGLDRGAFIDDRGLTGCRPRI
jgi:hypothetical protein